jgi:hypothetical protein
VIEECCWVAALGALADLGSVAPFRELLGCSGSGRRWTEAIALLNAARRAPASDPATALSVLEHARTIDDVTDERTPGVATLRGYREIVASEIARCSRTAPKMVGDAAVLRFTSGAQVHPVVATKWMRRLAPAVVIAANEGYLPGRVNFAVRCARPIDLLQWLRTLNFTPEDSGEYANGHARATGGSVSPRDFERFVRAIAARDAERRTI